VAILWSRPVPEVHLVKYLLVQRRQLEHRIRYRDPILNALEDNRESKRALSAAC
jgi:hypothetical protein